MTDAGLAWFPGLGFRPAVWTPPHRADGVDPDRLVVAPDADVPLAKVDPFGHLPPSGYAWGTWIPSAPTARLTAAELAGPVPGAPWQPGKPWYPATPLIPREPEPWFPCCVIRKPDMPPLPELPPVPVPASGILLLTAVAVFFIIRRFK